MSFNEFPHRTRGAVRAAMSPARISQPRAGVTRKDFTAPLNLPDTATDDQILSALDDKIAARDVRSAAARRITAEDAMYASIFGSNVVAVQAPVALSDEELYSRVMGA